MSSTGQSRPGSTPTRNSNMNSPLAIATAITANVNRFWDTDRETGYKKNPVSYETFHAEQHRLWGEAEAAGIVRAVSALLPVNQRN